MKPSSMLRCLGLSGLAAWVYVKVIRPWHITWGATEIELRRGLPGDQLVSDAKLDATHAITINAPARTVWAWLIQMGQGRAGLYSYDFLENIAGLQFHSSDRIVPELQHLREGDHIKLDPNGVLSLEVNTLQPNSALVLSSGLIDARTMQKADTNCAPPIRYINMSWAFVLEAMDTNTTRLVERIRLDWNPGVCNWVMYRVFLEPISFFMEQKMLRGIKGRAEGSIGRY
jgi:hypothetical protein